MTLQEKYQRKLQSRYQVSRLMGDGLNQHANLPPSLFKLFTKTTAEGVSKYLKSSAASESANQAATIARSRQMDGISERINSMYQHGSLTVDEALDQIMRLPENKTEWPSPFISDAELLLGLPADDEEDTFNARWGLDDDLPPKWGLQ